MSRLLKKPASYPATNTSHLHSTLQFMTSFWERQALQKTVPSTLEAKGGKETCPRSQSKKAGHKLGLLYHKLATFTACQPQGAPGHTLVACLTLSRKIDRDDRVGGVTWESTVRMASLPEEADVYT